MSRKKAGNAARRQRRHYRPGSESRDFIRRRTSREGRRRAGEFFVDELTASEKAEFIRKFGLEAWCKVVERTYG